MKNKIVVFLVTIMILLLINTTNVRADEINHIENQIDQQSDEIVKDNTIDETVINELKSNININEISSNSENNQDLEEKEVSIEEKNINDENNTYNIKDNEQVENKLQEGNLENSNTSLVGLVIENGKLVYYENGEKVAGFKNINGKLYFFSSKDKSASQGWKAAYGKVWYQDETGEVVRGPKTIDGKLYYFNLENGYQEVGFKEIDQKLYFFSSKDKTVSQGWKAAYGKVWYQDETGEVVRGPKTIDGKLYYFNLENGYQEVGFKEIDQKLYFFSSKDKTVSQGWKAAYGKVWYQDETGEVVRGPKTIDGKLYYFNLENGYQEVGFKEIDQKLYFFSSKDKTVSQGWKAAYGKVWYQDETGEVVRGLQTIENRNYLFGNDGYLQGFKYVNNQMYYYNPDGTQAKGIQRLAGCYYKFNEITGAFEKFVNQKIVIDVSVHQGDIDWNAVKNSGKIDAVILRIGYGVRWMDSKFLRNVNELNRLGIPYSVYLFSYAENAYEAELEADNLINIVKNNPVYIASNLFSIYYDLESWYISSTGENSNGISKETYGNMITTFINKVTSSLGIKTRIYASKNYIETRFPESVRPYMGLIAQWSNNFTYTGTYEGWQYTDCASVPGINGPVDMSIFYY